MKEKRNVIRRFSNYLPYCSSWLLCLQPVLQPLAPTEAPAAKKKVIGFSVYDMQYGFFQDMEKGTKEAAQAAGYDYVLVDEKSSRIDNGFRDDGPDQPGY